MTKRERKRDENLADNPPANPDDDALELALSVAELSSAATVKVYREREDGRKEFVVDLAPQPHLDTVIAKKCGPGRYQLRFFGKRSKERPTGYVTSTHIDIGDVPVDLEPDVEPKRDRIDALLEGNVIGMFKQMNDIQEMNLRAMQRSLEPPARAANPLLEQVITAAIPLALPKLLDFLFDRRPAVDPMTQTKELLELMKHQGREKTGLDELRAQMAFAKELRDLTTPGEAGGDGGDGQPAWVVLLERMADKAFDRFLAPKATATVADETTAGALPAGSEDPAAAVMPDELSFLRELLPQLTQWANQRRPAVWVAQTLQFEVQPQYHAVVVAALQGPDVMAKLLRFVPTLRPHAAWLEEVRGEVVKALGGVAESRAGTGNQGGESDDNGGGSRPTGNRRGQR